MSAIHRGLDLAANLQTVPMFGRNFVGRFSFHNMTPDEFLKATTPNALAPVSDSILDDLRNHGGSLLLTSNEGVARQIQAAVGSIEAEKMRCHARKPKTIEWWILAVSALAALVGFLSWIS